MTLEAARKNKGYTQKEAAKLLGISEYTLINYENGKTFPKIPTIKKMEKLYEVEYKDLFFSIKNTI